VFTGAGVSVENGIPPFRGEMGYGTKLTLSVLIATIFTKIQRNHGTF